MKKVKKNIDMLFLAALIILIYDMVSGIFPALKITYLLGLSALQNSRKDKLFIYIIQIIILIATYFIITNSLFKTLIYKKTYYKKNFRNFQGMNANFLKLSKNSTPPDVALPVINWLLRHLDENYSTDFTVSAYLKRWIESGAVLHNQEYHAALVLSFVSRPDFEGESEENLFLLLQSVSEGGKLKTSDIKNMSQIHEEKLVSILEGSYKEALLALENDNAVIRTLDSKEMEQIFLNEKGIILAKQIFGYRSFLIDKISKGNELLGEEATFSMAFGIDKRPFFAINALMHDGIVKL